MEDVAAPYVGRVPLYFRSFVHNGLRGVILVAPHDLEGVVGVVCNCVEADEFMCHRNGQELLCDVSPLVHRLIVPVGPVEEELRAEVAVGPRVGEIQRLIRIHGDEYLYQGEDSL